MTLRLIIAFVVGFVSFGLWAEARAHDAPSAVQDIRAKAPERRP